MAPKRPFNGMVILKYRKGPLVPIARIAFNSDPTDRVITDMDALETEDVDGSAAPANDDGEYMPDAPENEAGGNTAATAAAAAPSTAAIIPRRTLRTNTARQTEQTTAAPAEGSSTPTPPRRTPRTRTVRQTEHTDALPAGRTLRSRTVRQTEQTNALPTLPAAARAPAGRSQAARTERVPHLTQRQLRERNGRRAGVIELPWVSAPQPYRAPSPTDSEIAAAHISSASLLGMPPVVFKQIAEYILIYQQPEELVQKNSHRRMAEVTKAHVLTVSSEKVVRKPTHKQVARNLNTASLTNFFLVCRHFRDVGLKVYYSKNTFKFSSDGNLEDWAAAIPSRRKFVRSIQLDSHWEMGIFRGGGARLCPENLSMMSDYGIIHTDSSRLFPNLEKFHLSIGVASQWQRDAFQKTRGNIPPAIEDVWWKMVKEWANRLLDSLKRSKAVSRKVDIGYSLIFDGAFLAGKTNDASYWQRMKGFAWNIRGIDADLPKRPTLKELLPVLPGPLLPNMAAVVARAPMGAWSQKYVNDPSIDSGSPIAGTVVRLHNWPGIMTELLSPERLAMAPAKRARRVNWAAVMSELLTSNLPARFLEKKVRAQQAALAQSASLKRNAIRQTKSVSKASWIAVHAELKASVAERAKRSAWKPVMTELTSSDLPAKFLKTITERDTHRSQWAAVAAEVTSREHKAKRQADAVGKALWPAIFAEFKSEMAEMARVDAALEKEAREEAEAARAQAARAQAVSQRQAAVAGQGMRRTLLKSKK